MSARSEVATADAKGARFGSWRLALGALVAVVLLAIPLWGPPVLTHLAFFQVRRVEILGLRYTPASEVLQRLRVDTTRSVWHPLAPLEARVAAHPQIADVVITRKLPGTLVVSVTERRPVALVSVGSELRAVDERGVRLPLDPSRTPVDAPLVSTTPQDARVYRLLGEVQRSAPRLYARISSVRSAGPGELLLQFADLSVRALTTATLARLSDIEPVERDLARRNLRAAELDLRYRDQVIARLP